MDNINNVTTVTGREEKILIKIFRGWDAKTEQEMMMVQDLFGILTDMNRVDTTVVLILNYNGTQEEKAEAIKYTTSLFDNQEDIVILSWAYVSTKEFPEDKYYDPHGLFKGKEYVQESIEAGKKPVPFDEIIERESKLLESVGFIDFNNYVQYENSKAYLYGNSLGKEVIEYTNKLLKDFHDNN